MLYRLRRSRLLPGEHNVPGADDGAGVPVSRATGGSHRGTHRSAYCGSHHGSYGSSHCSAYCYPYGGAHCHSSGDSGRPCAEPCSISFL